MVCMVDVVRSSASNTTANGFPVNASVLNTSTSWNGLFISDSPSGGEMVGSTLFSRFDATRYRRPSRAAAVSRGSSMRRTASSTASLQHRDATAAVLNSARLNEEAPHDSRAASPIRLNRRCAAAGEVISRRSYLTRISVVSNPAAAAWPSVDTIPPDTKATTIHLLISTLRRYR